jgi:O-antigen/teichoic acid export membrane protein
MTIAALFLARVALTTLFGPTFGAATRVLQVLLLALIVNLIAGHCRTALVAMGRQRYDLGAVAASAIFHVMAKLILIPLVGIAGTACGTLAGEALLMLIAMSLVRTNIRVPGGGA